MDETARLVIGEENCRIKLQLSENVLLELRKIRIGTSSISCAFSQASLTEGLPLGSMKRLSVPPFLLYFPIE